MNQKLNPNWVVAALAGFALLFFAIFPVSIEIHPIISTAQETPTVEYTLRTVLGQTVPPMAFVGVGGDIDGLVNPDLHAVVGDVVKITVINGDPVLHDMKIDEFDVSTGELTQKDQVGTVMFKVTASGEFDYYCTVPGHREVGMVGKIIVTEAGACQGPRLPRPRRYRMRAAMKANSTSRPYG